MTDIERIAEAMRLFTAERNWDQFHSPKNLAMALAGEAGELLEHFQWLSEADSRNLIDSDKRKVSLEMADVLLYLVRMADVLGIDLIKAANTKIEINAGRYPADRFKGSNRKYNAD